MSINAIEIERTAIPCEGPRGAVVFLHGIYSDHKAAFGTMMTSFTHNSKFDRWDVGWFDYRYRQPMVTNGDLLHKALLKHFDGWSEKDDVILVCHSMGGLVARLAVLRGGLPFVKRIIMLGTPNFGAVRTAGMSLLAQLVMASSRRIYGVFSRKQGILDLTRVPKIFEAELKADAVLNTERIEYVTIPGLFFHEGRGLFESGDWGTWRGRKNLFAALRVGVEMLDSYVPVWKIGMKIPHDGIVEEFSNRLIPDKDRLGYLSEKTSQIDFPEAFAAHTYVHVIHKACSELTHVTLQHEPKIIDLVADLILAPSLDQWFDTVIKSGSFHSLTPRPRFHKPAHGTHASCG